MKSPRSPLVVVAASLAAAGTMGRCDAFVVRGASSAHPQTSSPVRPRTSVDVPPEPSSLTFAPAKHGPGTTAAGGPLRAIVDVPDGFFTTMFLTLGLTNTLIRKVQREALEESAWRQRIEDAREVRLADDPTLTELDLIREEADAAPRPYGEEARERREAEERMGRGGMKVLTIEDAPGAAPKRYKRESYGEGEAYRPLTDDQIDDFEVVYGVSYDPYYDEPYEEDELPDDDEFNVDRLYGDRRYENGEVFYRDEDSGLYWRQGCKPRIKKMWGIS